MDVVYSSDQIEQLLTCAVCLDRFKSPKLLPCQHTFCRTPCLEGLVDRSIRRIRCPECRAEHRLPITGTSGFPNNITIIGFLELPQQPHIARQLAPGDRLCPVCGDENPLSRCDHCDKFICDRCKRSHLDQLKLEVLRLVTQLRRAIPNITESIDTMENSSQKLRRQTESVKNEIDETIERHLKELKRKQVLLHSEVDAYFLAEVRSLRMHQENMEVELASITSFCDSVESILKRSEPDSGDATYEQLKKQCKGYMEQIKTSGTSTRRNEKQLRLIANTQMLNATISKFELSVTGDTRSDITTTDSNLSSYTSRASPPGHQSTPEPNRVAPNRDARTMYNSSNNGPRYQIPARTSNAPTWATSVEGRLENIRQSRLLSRPRQNRNSDTRMAEILSGGDDTHRNAYQNHTSDTRTSVPNRLTPRDTHPVRSSSIGRSVSNTTNLAAFAPQTQIPVRAPVRFDVTLDENIGDLMDEAENTISFRLSTSESTTVTVARNNYHLKGRACLRFGERGNASSQFTWPRGVAVSPVDDSILIADSSNHRVQVFDNTGRYIKAFGSYGQNNGEFDCLAGIAVNSNGHIVISDRYNHRIQVFDRNHTFIKAFGEEGHGDGQLNYPWGIACDSDGLIYVCDKENHRVQIFRLDGTFVRKFGGIGHAPGLFENPHYLAVSSENKVYVSDGSNHRIQVFSTEGEYLFNFGVQGQQRGQIKYPRGVAIDSQGFVLVGDSGNNRVTIYRADGRLHCNFGTWGSENGQFKGLEGVAILGNGNIVVSDRENHRIQVF